jgi:beta-lactamase regulating signal transducer with metallopeptidase domain
MTAAWMLCYLAVGGLLLPVAFGADAVLARLRFARRWAWAAVALMMCVLPLVLRKVPPAVQYFVYSGDTRQLARTNTQRPQSAVSTTDGSVVRFSVAAGRGNRVVVAPGSPFNTVNRWAILLWTVGSIVYGLLMLAAYRRMVRLRRQWTAAPDDIAEQVRTLTAAKTRVWCSDDVGPAVLGVFVPEIVLPKWVLTLDERSLELLLQHEVSHVIARDPLLLRLALASVLAMPWNLPMLIIYRLLHRAVEHDCDARVLEATGDARGYGRLLLDTAERRAVAGGNRGLLRAEPWLPVPIPGIGSRRTELEKRLRALAPTTWTWQTRALTLAASLVIVVGVLAACSVPSPERMRSNSLQNPLPLRSDVALRAMKPTPRNGGANGGGLSVLDTVVAVEQLTDLMPRGVRLADSIVTAAARVAEPDAFSAQGTGDTHVWILLDQNYRVLRSTTGREFYSMIVTNADGSESRFSVGSRTTHVRLSWSNKNFQLAFPGLRLSDIGLWSSAEEPVGKRKVRVLWARFIGPDSILKTINFGRPTGVTPPPPGLDTSSTRRLSRP